MYRELLGTRWDALPASVQEAHRPGPVCGHVDITRGSTALTRLLGAMARMPPEGRAVAVRLAITQEDKRYVWRRRFGDRWMRSDQWVEAHRGTQLLMERYGPVLFGFAVEPSPGGLRYVQRACWLCLGPLRLRVPRWLSPQVEGSLEHHAGTTAMLDVEIRGPMSLGRICRYQGHVQAERTPALGETAP